MTRLRVGVIGGGQLARMMIPAAVNLGVDIRVLAEQQDSSAVLAASAVDDYRDIATVLAFAQEVDVITFDHEHVPAPVLQALLDAGHSIHPGPHALAVAQDKIVMRAKLQAIGAPLPEWAAVSTPEELDQFIADNGGRSVVKTPRGGYDGKGVRMVTAASEVQDWFEVADGSPLLAEEAVDFTRELAQLLARRPSGDTRVWPLVETVQRDGICAEVLSPAPGASARIAEVTAHWGTRIATELGVTGVLAVEMFETADERILINELAMRPHNSGHWTIEGSVTSQFEQHLRAVLDLPLGDPSARSPWTVMVNVLGGPESGALSDVYDRVLGDQPDVKVHNYGKQSRPGRKVGHVTAFGDELEDVVYRARSAAADLNSSAL